MKFILLIAIVLVCKVANAQLLKLKPGQKFSYESISDIERKDKFQFKNYSYWKINFVVTSQANKVYTIKASPEIIFTKSGVGIDDSTVPFEAQPPKFMPIANKVMTLSSYNLKVKENGDILGVSGIAQIKAAIIAKLKGLNTPEGNQKHTELANRFIQDAYFIAKSSFFDSTVKQADKITDNGLITSYDRDTTEMAPEEIEVAVIRRTKFRLVTPGVKDDSSALLLMTEAKDSLDYASYYTPLKIASRKIEELTELYDREAGSQTIDEEIMKQLNILDKGFSKDNYEYLGAKLKILSVLDSGDYSGILDKVPYEYLPDGIDIENKLTVDLRKGDVSNVKKAIALLFTKFKEQGYYPVNMDNSSSTIHDEFGGLIYRLQSKDSILVVYNVIQETERLQIPIVTEMLAGMKTYVRAKLATSQDELADIASTHFSSVFDKAGRYRILIYDELVKKQLPDSIKLAYIDYTIDLNKKKIALVNSGAIENVDPFLFEHYILNDKVVYKKNLADAYYRKSKLEKSTEESYLQMAADYLPSQQDIIDNQSGLMHEYKFNPFVSYTDLYLASGGNAGKNDEARLNKYIDMVIFEPERYSILKESYYKAYPKGDFKAFFNAALKSKLPMVPKFSLNERSGKVVANKDQQSKFVFVDFWGTWCGSCVAEIDKIEAVHRSNPNPEKLMVTTIACYDKKRNVDDFMAKEKYSYEVLMSDGQVEKDFKIRGYPTKLLLLPNGVYLTIPYYSNYNDILAKYLKWEI
jgi:thiol-disulfide isomerase/thioredoxin